MDARKVENKTIRSQINGIGWLLYWGQIIYAKI